MSGDVFVFSPFESVTAREGSRVRVLACVCSGVDSDAGVVAESGATVYAGDGVTVGAEAGSLVYAEDGSCVRLLDDGVRVFASAGALVLYAARSELALVQGGTHVKRTLTYGVAQWLDESGVMVFLLCWGVVLSGVGVSRLRLLCLHVWMRCVVVCACGKPRTR